MCLIAWLSRLTTVKRLPRHSSKEIWSIVKAAKGGDARRVKLLRVAGARGAEETLRVTEVAERNRDRIARRQVDKFAERRAQLAAAALQTLAEQGYARTSLRDIAQHSDFSHGVLHYYFSDKIELITYCVRQYKAECVTRYDSIVATAGFGRRTQAGLRRSHGRHPGRGSHDAPALVRPAEPEPVR